jgi:uncharacterized membrane protein
MTLPSLLAPLVVCGLLIGAKQFSLALGALLLVATNVICVNLTGVLTFLLQGIRPKTWWESRSRQEGNANRDSPLGRAFRLIDSAAALCPTVGVQGTTNTRPQFPGPEEKPNVSIGS